MREFPKIEVRKGPRQYRDGDFTKAVPISGKKVRTDIEKFAGYEEIIHGDIEELLGAYEKHKRIFHRGGNLAEIYELTFGGRDIVIKEIRDTSKIKEGFLLNPPFMEMEIQDKLHNSGVSTPLPVSYIRMSGHDFKNRKMVDRKIIVMEKIHGLSIGDYYRALNDDDSRIDKGYVVQKLKELSVGDFMNKLRREVEKMHDAGYVHGDLTFNNVMIDDSGEPVIIDFGTARRKSGDDPYYLGSTVVIRNGKRFVEPSARLESDEQNLQSIEGVLREMMKSIDFI